MASLGKKSRACSAIFVVLALLLVSLAVCAPAARAQSWGEVVLHSFDGTDGATPDAGADPRQRRQLLWHHGRIGGADPAPSNGAGTVFKLTPSGTLTTLYSFCSQANCTDGDASSRRRDPRQRRQLLWHHSVRRREVEGPESVGSSRRHGVQAHAFGHADHPLLVLQPGQLHRRRGA